MDYPPEAGFRLGPTPADDLMPGKSDSNQCQRILSDTDRFKCAEATELDPLGRDRQRLYLQSIGTAGIVRKMPAARPGSCKENLYSSGPATHPWLSP